MENTVSASTLIGVLKTYINKYGDLPIVISLKNSSNVLNPVLFLGGICIKDVETGEKQNAFMISDYNAKEEIRNGQK